MEFLEDNLSSNISQRNYKEELFCIFRNAYILGYVCPLRYYLREVLHKGQHGVFVRQNIEHPPYINADSILYKALEVGFIEGDTPASDERYMNLQKVRMWWEENGHSRGKHSISK